MTIQRPITENRSFFPLMREILFTGTGLLVFLLVVYSNSFQTSFHYDDFMNIVDNPNVHLREFSVDGLKMVLHGKKLNQQFDTRPLSYLTFALNFFAGQTSVFGYHAVNFCIHYAAAVLLFFLIYITVKIIAVSPETKDLAYPVALLSVFFWSSHPIQVTAVTYIVQRMTSLAALFCILSMLCYVIFRLPVKNGRGTGFWIGLCVCCGLLALASKENAVMLPASILLYEVIIIRNGRHPKNNGPVFVLAAVIIGIAALAFLVYPPDFLLRGYQNRYFTLSERLLTEPRIFLFYLSLLVYPVSSRFTFLHDIEISTGLLTPWTTLPAIVLTLAIIACGLVLARKKPLIGFGILFFFLNHLIEGSVIPLELVYEHRNYLPSAFLFPPFFSTIFRLLPSVSRRKPISVLLLLSGTVFLISQSHTTWMRNEIFSNEWTLWKDNAEKSPHLSVVHVNLGRILWAVGRLEEAQQAYRSAEKINRFNNVYQRRALLFNRALQSIYQTHDYPKALKQLKEALDIRKASPHIWKEIAHVYLLMEDYPSALRHVDFSLSIWPDNPDLLFTRIITLIKSSQLDQALQETRKTVALYPEDTRYLYAMATIYQKQNKRKKSIAVWKQIVERAPDCYPAYFALIELYAGLGKHDMCYRYIDFLLQNRNGETIEQLLAESMRDPAKSLFTPRPDVILPVVRAYAPAMPKTDSSRKIDGR